MKNELYCQVCHKLKYTRSIKQKNVNVLTLHDHIIMSEDIINHF